MSAPRRRILRPAALPEIDERRERRVTRLRSQLVSDQQSLTRWMARLKRAFHSIEKLQRRVCRAERLLAKLSNGR